MATASRPVCLLKGCSFLATCFFIGDAFCKKSDSRLRVALGAITLLVWIVGPTGMPGDVEGFFATRDTCADVE
jgi:hypothetical protein